MITGNYLFVDLLRTVDLSDLQLDRGLIFWSLAFNFKIELSGILKKLLLDLHGLCKSRLSCWLPGTVCSI